MKTHKKTFKANTFSHICLSYLKTVEQSLTKQIAIFNNNTVLFATKGLLPVVLKMNIFEILKKFTEKSNSRVAFYFRSTNVPIYWVIGTQ